MGLDNSRACLARSICWFWIAACALTVATADGRAQGMLDDVPEKGLQKVTPGTPAVRPKPETPKAAPRPPERDERLTMPERPTTNYDFLQGCWISDEFRHSEQHLPGTSTYCFDAAGKGTLVFQGQLGTCRVAARASYQGGLLRMSDSDGDCSGGSIWYADYLDCERGSNGIASCRGRSKDAATGREWKWLVTFRRKTDGGQRPAGR